MASAPPPICFVAGTLIALPDGQRRIEDLAVGDEILNAAGEVRTVRWIGRRTYRRRAGRAFPEKFCPVRISKDALGQGRPATDLLVSRKHGVLVDGQLVPAKYLVDGRDIVQTRGEGLVELRYFHVELESHDILLANGLECESLLCNGRNIEMFENFAEHLRLYPGDSAVPAVPCAPVYAPSRTSPLARLRRRVSARVKRLVT